MAFGKAFKTRKEANDHAKKLNSKGRWGDRVQVRFLNKKVHPRRKNRFHVGDEIDWLNFA